MLNIMLNRIKIFIFMHKKKIVGVLFFVTAIILAVALYSFNPYDQSWFYYNSQKTGVTNLLGCLGSDISALFFYLFGVSSFLFVFFLCYLAYLLCVNISFVSEIERFFSFLFLPFISAALLHTKNLQFFGPMVPMVPGGVVGSGLKIIVLKWFDYTLAVLFLYALLFVCVIFICRAAVTQLLFGVSQMCCFVVNKQKFLLPAYAISKKAVYVLGAPFAFSFHFCKKLFRGEDVIGGGKSILTFESYGLENRNFDQPVGPHFTQADQAGQAGEVQDIAQQKSNKSPLGFGGFEKETISLKNSLDKKFVSKKPTYTLPDVELFDYYGKNQTDTDAAQMGELKERAKILEEKLEMFGVFGKVVSIKRGPVITLFEYQPKADSKISKIVALGDDLALALKALSIRIIAPIPGRSVVGFEVANIKREDVLLSSIATSKPFANFSGYIPLILGKDTVGNNIVVDLAKMPHLLIAGSTGSGKSVALNSLLISMLYKLTPDELNLILIDPKRLEFSAYEDISHLLFPIVTDHKKVSPILKWVVSHMEERYEKMAKVGARNIFDYNSKIDSMGNMSSMSFIVIIIDELADLMMTAGRDIEGLIARIAQMARAAGIHMIVATQRPSVDVITGLIKVNFPSRISFRVTSKVDSRTILDCCGAEKLLGRGDMLFLGSGSSSLSRLHGAYVSGKEIEKVVSHIRAEREVVYRDLAEYVSFEETKLSDADDLLYQDVLGFLDSIDEVSISLLQRKFRIGYNRSARIIEKLESEGLILPSDGGKTRKVVR